MSSGMKQRFHGVLDYVISQPISAHRYRLCGHDTESLLAKQTNLRGQQEARDDVMT